MQELEAPLQPGIKAEIETPGVSMALGYMAETRTLLQTLERIIARWHLPEQSFRSL